MLKVFPMLMIIGPNSIAENVAGVADAAGTVEGVVLARDRCDHLTALTFIYGQTHSKEVECARHVADLLGVEHKLVDISFLGDVAWYSALTNPEAFPIPKDTPSDQLSLLDMVTGRPAKALGLGDGYGLREGAPADLVVMASESPGTVVVERPRRLAVFRSGKVVSAGAGADVLGIDGPEV